MVTHIQLHRSGVTGATPDVSTMFEGEPAVNFPDKKLYVKGTDGSLITLTEPAPVTSVNGETGVVTITDLVGVATFNGASGDVQGVSSVAGLTGTISAQAGRTAMDLDEIYLKKSIITGTEQSFTTALKNKVDAIEASADVTDTANVTSAGALMDSELASIANVKALDQSVVSGASPTFGTANFTDASNKRLLTDAQESKLDAIEASADVTDSTNVAAAVASSRLNLVGISASAGISAGSLTIGPNNYHFPTADGSAGQVLMTDGSDNLSFQTIKFMANFVLDSDVPLVTGIRDKAIYYIPYDNCVVTEVHLRSDDASASGDATSLAVAIETIQRLAAAGGLNDANPTGVTLLTVTMDETNSEDHVSSETGLSHAVGTDNNKRAIRINVTDNSGNHTNLQVMIKMEVRTT